MKPQHNTTARRLTRRGFLKTLAGTGLAGSASLASGMFPPSAHGAGTGGSAPAPSGRGEKANTTFATLIDISACVGCNACVDACRQRNAARHPEPKKPFPAMFPASVKAEDWSDRRNTDDRLTPYNWLYIQQTSVTHEGQRHDLNIPRRCLHCDNPPCANLCPWGAARREASGTVSIDADICLGGAKCRTVCPWHIPQRQTGVGLYLDLLPRYAGNGVMYKCDRCADVVAGGGVPACVQACPNAVQTLGPRDEIMATARRLAAERGWHLYGLDENGGTSTIYLSPVPFAAIQSALDAARPEHDGTAASLGPGRPHFRPVADSMRDQTMLATALVTAPLAGAGAALLRMARGFGDMARGQNASPSPAAPSKAASVPTHTHAARSTRGTRGTRGATALRPVRAIWLACAAVLAVSGMAQMPIAARYGISSVPGLAWTADFHLTHLMHYAAAAVVLGLGAWLAARAFTGAHATRLLAARRLTAGGTLRLALVAGLAVTGAMRVVKNLPGFDWGTATTLFIDWGHLGLAGLLGMAALALALAGRGAWTEPRTPAQEHKPRG